MISVRYGIAVFFFSATICIITVFFLSLYNEHLTDYPLGKTKILFSLGPEEGSTGVSTKCNKNNTECLRFFKMMKSWPPGKPKAVIYVLTKMGRQETLISLLRSVDRYFTERFHYPVIIFHSKDFVSCIPRIRNSTNSSIFFQEIHFKLPDFLLPKRQWPRDHCKPTRSIGYKHMCRFQSMLVTEQPIIKHLDYIWRLDDDSRLRNPVKHDVFRFMRDRDIYYGYMCKYQDSPPCVYGLWNATRKYIKMKQIKTQFFHQMPERMTYFNNFEISKFSLWTSPEYKEYINYIDQLGGIFYYRWGDGPIKTIGVSLFLPENKTHRFRSIGYLHFRCGNSPPRE